MEYKFIINKNSGSGLSHRQLNFMSEKFRNELGQFEFILPESGVEAETVARESLSTGVENIVAVGGDGTANSVANGFFIDGAPAHNGTALLLSNTGAGSDYYASITRGHKDVDWMRMVSAHEKRRVDVGRITFLSDNGYSTRHFLNMASVGMIADVVMTKERLGKWIPAPLRYTAPTLKSLFTWPSTLLELKTDKETIEVDALTVSISKGKFAGRGMWFGLDVELDDGMFEVTIFENSGPVRMAMKLWRMYSDSYMGVEGIRKIWTRKLRISAAKPIPCEFDGELYGTTDIEVEVLPKEIFVGFPA
ncbi:MAG: diacylglycerol kinase family protein [Nitrospinota bacterium]|nr:diacylglycerol kinase family protein [Nitrospinota bacterium]MDH5755162.1 diacylglycerol kinase family protein [Nitrospinota bacterium]